MKNVLIIIFLFTTVLFIGCGKSTEMKKMESDLNGAIMKLHETEMGSMKQVEGLLTQIDAAMHDSLLVRYPEMAEGQSARDLKAAKEKLHAARASMETWMKDHKPYDEKMTHEEVMANLTKDKDALVKAKTEMEGAIAAATTALNSYKQAADELIAKASAPIKKGKK